MFRLKDQYVDSLYSNYHVQMGNEELLLPVQTQTLPEPYPTALVPPDHQPSGLVSHVTEQEPSEAHGTSNYAGFPEFHPSNFLSVTVNRKLGYLPPEIKKPRTAPSAPRVLSDLAPPGANLYEATYSGVDVYELIYMSHSLMRRRDDSWVNATHILKIAGIEKGKRTKILEKEVQGERHEKVQGGYGKYQGTWVPIEMARSIAKQFNVYEPCAPILEIP